MRSLSIIGKLKELCHEMERYRWNILGMGEVRWPGVGEIFTDEGHKVWYIGEEKKREKGVAFLVHKNTLPSVMECRPVSSRITSIRLAASPKNVTIMQIYAPTSSHTDQEIEDFYQEQQ